MSGLTTLAHRACVSLSDPGHGRFVKALDNPRGAQQEAFERQLRLSAASAAGARLGIEPGMSLQQFQAKVPISEYEDWRELVERQRADGGRVVSGSPCSRYQPTSGSTSRRKWIPYTAAFLEELNHAIEPWIVDLYRLEPRLRRGRHYWSLSWVPSSLRQQIDSNVNDDKALLPWTRRLFMALTEAVPSWIAYAPTAESSVFASLCHLAACRELSLISVWSPTFMLNVLQALAEQREAVAEALDRGGKGGFGPGLEGRPCPHSPRAAALLRRWDGRLDSAFFSELWPQLGLISAWDTSSSAGWARKLREYLPGAHFQGKGLWATEGVVTIPFRGGYPLAVRSHFYEFVDLASGDALPVWELREGQEVRPVLSTGSGFLRYALRDRMVVSDFIGRTPSFTFLGRLDGTDMVGEKLDPAVAQTAMAAAVQDGDCRPLTLMGVMEPGEFGAPFYLMLCEGAADAREDHARAQRLERQLRDSFHYDLARDLGQLGPARCVTRPDAMQLYQLRAVRRDMVAGDMKVEVLVLWNDDLPQALVEALRAEEGSASCRQQGAIVHG